MSFLAPLYALGLLAISLPIIFHLIQRRPQGQVLFGSLMFLSPSAPRMTRRSRLDHLLLLLLRALALTLLVLAFTRPLWRSIAMQAMSQPERRTLLLVDTSASMQREDLWQQAITRVERHLADLAPTDAIALATFDSAARTLLGFDELNKLEFAQRAPAIREALANVKPSSQTTDLGAALIAAADMFEAAKDDAETQSPLPPKIVLVTDLQDGSDFNQLEGYEWPSEVQVELQLVQAAQSTNANAVILAREESSQSTVDELRVRVHNSEDASTRSFRLNWANDATPITGESDYQIDVPPGENRTIRMKLPESPVNRIELAGDSQPFDNIRYLAQPSPIQKRVLYLGEEAADPQTGLLYYLQRASFNTPYQQVTIERHNAGEDIGMTLTPHQVPLVVVAQEFPPTTLEALQSYLQAGGRVLVVLDRDAEQLEPLVTNLKQLAADDQLAVEEAKVSEYAMLERINFQHPLFAPFADPRFSDFTKIRFWNHRKVNLGDSANWKVIAQFDDDAPALVEKQFDRGRLWILTAGWQPSDSQLALSTKFVPLMTGMVDPLGGRLPLESSYEVGSRVEVPESEFATSITQPDGATVSLKTSERSFVPQQPGIYRLSQGEHEQAFAVNLAVGESRTSPFDPAQLERFGIKFGESQTLAELQEQQRQMRDVELEHRQQFWRWLALAAICVLAIETWLGGWLSRPLPAVEAT